MNSVVKAFDYDASAWAAVRAGLAQDPDTLKLILGNVPDMSLMFRALVELGASKILHDMAYDRERAVQMMDNLAYLEATDSL